MQWNNLYLIPIVLFGGLVAFFFGRVIVGRVLYALSRIGVAPVNTAPALTAPSTASPQQAIPSYPRPEPPVIRIKPRRQPLAERREEWDSMALSLADQREAATDMLRALDLEEARIAALREEARKSSKSTNVLIGKLQTDVATAGPLTTAMQLTDAVQEILRSAAAARDSQAPKS